MSPRLFQDVDPRTLKLPPSRASGADLWKLQRQIAKFGASTNGMPIIEVSRGTDDGLMVNNGVTRATRVAKLSPGTKVRVEIIDDLPISMERFKTVGDSLP